MAITQEDLDLFDQLVSEDLWSDAVHLYNAITRDYMLLSPQERSAFASLYEKIQDARSRLGTRTAMRESHESGRGEKVLREEFKKILTQSERGKPIGTVGEVLDVEVFANREYEPAGWLACFSTELAALRVAWAYRRGEKSIRYDSWYTSPYTMVWYVATKPNVTPRLWDE